MDTVTEADMAVGMALQGGVGILHCHCEIEAQVAMVEHVKRFENGFIANPFCMRSDQPIQDLDTLSRDHGISGVPITEDGKIGSRLVGLVEGKLADFVEDRSQPLSSIMLSPSQVTTARHPCTLEEAHAALKSSKSNYLCVLDDEGKLKSLSTRIDLVKNRDFPNQCQDPSTQSLVVGAAIGSAPAEQERAQALVAAGVDIIVVDSRHGDTQEQVDMIQWLKATFPTLEVVGGNVATFSQARNLLEAGVDGLRVGMGVGSISTSQQVKAGGRAQLSAIYHSALLARKYDVPVIADGGIANTGCAIKALTMGASCVMMGSLLAGVEESPGEYYFQDGMRLKRYKGLTVQQVTADPMELGLISGVSGAVVDKGPMRRYVPFLNQSIRHGLQDMGIRSLRDLKSNLYDGTLRFELRSPAAQKEGRVHDLHMHQQRLFSDGK
mmetsp:Transcript_17352/g.50644  ORF Transcript_17352/g.50644 Transcript_17352/m.50644 type:complete len:438 (+) Transcript_17352:2-1315(+)